MAHIIRADTDEIVQRILSTMELNGFVDNKARFDRDSIMRKQIVYSDWDFMSCLSKFHDIEVIDYALERLKNIGVVDIEATYNKEAFECLRQEIKGVNYHEQRSRSSAFRRGKFRIPWTTISPTMERLLYMLSSVRKPKIIMAFGIYCGSTLVWIAGPTLGNAPAYECNKIYGVDIDSSSIELAMENFSKLTSTNHIKFIAEDGIKFAKDVLESCDLVYLDADKVYLDILKIIYDRLNPGAWVLAHDVTHRYIRKQYDDYLKFVRDGHNFSTSICFDLDLYGLELSIK